MYTLLSICLHAFLFLFLLVSYNSLHFCSFNCGQLFHRSLKRRSANHASSLHMQLYIRLTEFLLTYACFVIHFYMLTYSVWWSLWKWNFRAFLVVGARQQSMEALKQWRKWFWTFVESLLESLLIGSCQRIFMDVLGMKPEAAKIVPKLLNFAQTNVAWISLRRCWRHLLKML